jgi:glycosyltransferase involved in cell wall biosynthesis
MLSVIIPSRNVSTWPYTQKTVNDLFEKAVEEIEVVIVFDGYVLNPPLNPHKNLTIIYHPEAQGMRPSINEGVSVAKGKYIMKSDDHCMFAKGYDKALKDNCASDWLAVPSRYSLKGEEWICGYGPIDYLYLTYPYNLDDQFGFGFHGKKWHGKYGLTGGYFDREKERKGILIDDMLSFQGSCWFMHKSYFNKIGGMQQEGYYDHQEAQELGFKVWLSGGRCIVNKKTWYAHLHKGPKHSRGYKIFKHHMIKSTIYSADMWMNNKWPGQIYKLKYLIDKFWPLEAWPEDWDNPQRWENYNYESWHHTHEIRKSVK